jgi:hypothetical protein
MRKVIVIFAVALLPACAKPPTAMDACHKLETSGVAANCVTEKPAGLGANAIEVVHYDLPTVPGEGGAVWLFETDEKYDEMVKAFDDAKVLAGPFRYGSKARRIFTQFNSGASMQLGEKAKATVKAL